MPESAPDPAELEAVLDAAYAGFNARDLDATLALMDPAVVWSTAGDDQSLHGQMEVRAHWIRQWQSIDARVEPIGFLACQDGSMAVAVREVIRDLCGRFLSESHASHVYRFRDGLIASMRAEPLNDPKP